jgi:cellulose synthase/poly-beta-1,6-N-acetylglucosamine synthase-like glycosyltransferase
MLSFFGLFWNSYFIISSICKCFIPAKAFRTNTKYCSIIPEIKSPEASWLDVTIQLPVYKESLHEVIMPTLKSCIESRDFYHKNTGARCNIVVCDDGMMAFLRDNFPAAEMLWENILQTKGQVIKLSALLRNVPRASRRHLKGLHSKNVYEVFHRMLFYYHYQIGFVARSTVDRRGKFKKASNLNSHLRLALGAAQYIDDNNNKDNGLSFQDAVHEQSHNEDGSRHVMSGGDIRVGALICVNDADARMAESVILKTVPEFLNDNTLGFTQHTTKTMKDQRGESYFINLLTVYTDALYQGHFLLSSILGCHPPLVGKCDTYPQCRMGRFTLLKFLTHYYFACLLQVIPSSSVPKL